MQRRGVLPGLTLPRPRAGAPRALVQELGPFSIRVNSIAPGLIEIPVIAERLQNPQYRRAGIETSVLGRIGQPEDIAYCALYLASLVALRRPLTRPNPCAARWLGADGSAPPARGTGGP